MSGFEQITNEDKTKIASDFILHAPPGEFSEVFNDVRILINDDNLLKEGAGAAFARYNKDQFTPVTVDGADKPCLITPFNETPNGTFLDPCSKQVFKYDHLRKEARDPEPASVDQAAEPWRSALEQCVADYTKEHYPNGNSTVFGKSADKKINLVACIENHMFQPHNYWNGRWRSQWSLNFDPSGGSVEAVGLIKVQVHYYEDGNVQLVSHKEVKIPLEVTTAEATAAELLKGIKNEEYTYQRTLGEDYLTMSDTTFKALRRQLPITRAKFNWKQPLHYDIGKNLNQK
ncbi:F-actin-capping protein subunit alpha-2-like [Diadema antillarum]|uniref:F-actin-capping protein subunit alpha-2-like n=1 Tax=Diadema antillarum TaxID=105358 RepID=UPI003A8AA9F2